MQTSVQIFSTAILEASDDDHIGRNVNWTIDAQNNLKIVNFKILTQDCVWGCEWEVKISDMRQDAEVQQVVLYTLKGMTATRQLILIL
jgi:hypothetical protein